MFKRFLATAGALVCAQALMAGVASTKDLPADTKWVLRLDLQSAQASPLVTELVGKIAPAKRQQAQAKIAAFKALFGIDLLKDIQEVVVAGNGSADKGGAAYIYGSLDAARLTTILAGNATFSSSDYNGLKLLSWTDDNDKKQKFGSFIRPGLTVMSDKKEAVTAALDVLSGKVAGLAAGSSLKGAFANGGAFLTVVAEDVPSIIGEQPKGQALRQAQSLCLNISAPQPDLLSASLAVKASSDETAQQIRQALTGIQALALLRAAEAPEQATLAQLAKINGEGSSVSIALDLPKSAIENAIRQREAREAAKRAAAAAAAAVPAATAAPAAAAQ